MEKTKKLCILAGILVVLCILTFAVSSCEERKEEIKSSDEIILQIDSESITEIGWKNDSVSMNFQKADSWIYLEDENFPVDSDVMDYAVSIFEEFGVSFVIENVEDYGQYGLDHPDAVITLKTDSETYELELGDFSNMDSKRYVSIGDGNVYLVTEDPMDYISTDLSDLIDHDEIPDLMDAKEITFEGAENYKIVKNEELDGSFFEEDIYFTEEDGQWKALDTDNISNYLDNIYYLDYTDYVIYDAEEADLKKYGLDEPQLAVTAVYEDEDGENSFTLRISRAPEEIKEEEKGNDADTFNAYALAGDSSIIYRITESEYNDLMAASYRDLRRQEILPVDFLDIESIDITLDNSTYTLTSKEKLGDVIWYYEKEEMDITNFESTLAYMTAKEFTEETSDGTEEIRLILHVDMDEVSEIELVFYRYDGSSCMAEIDGISTALVDRSEVVDLIEAVNAVILN